MATFHVSFQRVSALGALALAACGPQGQSPSEDESRIGSAVQLTTESSPELATSTAASAQPSFTAFESGQVRPLALSPSGELLFAVNTPDNRLEIFRVHSHGDLEPVASVPVGLEPVAVAVRDEHEVWVVNHLSDSVSIVRLDGGARVARTLLVGDEPRDIVFAGPDRARAFIATAHRGQNTPSDPRDLTTPGVGRADVWVFDARALGTSLGGDPLGIVNLFSDTPRALAVTPDGNTVYAAAFHSGSRTTVVSGDGSVPPGGQEAGGLPAPNTNVQGVPQPEVGLIVKFRAGPGGMHWFDKLDRIWDSAIRFSLPDKDVFAIDATANPPVEKAGKRGAFQTVGTVLFNMVVNPISGRVYVANTDANNDSRFEGHGVFASQFNQSSDLHTVRGHIAESRVTVIDPARGSVTPRHLNKHIDYAADPQDGSEAAKSLAFPMGMAVSHDGRALYVAAFGSSKVGVFDTSALERDTFVPDERHQISVSGGGPSGLVLDDANEKLYVLTRFDNAISVLDTRGQREIAHVRLYNPEPPSITRGRRFLYDARSTSAHGDSACASCHIFGDFDSLAWDLGDADNPVVPIPGATDLVTSPTFVVPLGVNHLPPERLAQLQSFHPLKGPMTTQSLRGMANHGSMHWRGDRTGGNDAPSIQPSSGIFDEDAAFKKFNVAFPGLLGRADMLSASDMQAFTDFILQVTYPPNPIRHLDDSLTPDQQAGHDFFFSLTNGGLPSDQVKPCNGCHVLDPSGNAGAPGVTRPGFFGTDGRYTFEGETQIFKVPHLRNLYQKIGTFGTSPSPMFPESSVPDLNPFMGDQVRGFGFLHDGSVDTLNRFHAAGAFIQTDDDNPGGIPFGPAGDTVRKQLEAFLLAFDSNLAPVVGQQVTLTAENGPAASERVLLLETRARAGDCELIAKGQVRGHSRGFLYVGDVFKTDRVGERSLTDIELRALAASHTEDALTFTCVPPGSGRRIGIDRDDDGVLDGDETSISTPHK